VASAMSRSPAASATTDRLNRFPGKRRRRPEQTPGLDGTVQELGSLGQLAAHVPNPGQDRIEAVQGISPARSRERARGHDSRARRPRRRGPDRPRR
jgi:hypothetical protein